VACSRSGGTILRVRSDAAFLYWWDGSFGNAALVGSHDEARFAISDGSESHDFWSKFTNGLFVTTLDVKTSVGRPSCHAGFTLLKTLQDSPGR